MLHMDCCSAALRSFIVFIGLAQVFPWMGCAYACASDSASEAATPYAGCGRIIPRSDHGLPSALAYPSFGDIQAHYLPNITSAVILNHSTQTQYFNYKAFGSNVTHQVWFDSPKTLAAKYQGALQEGVRALGVWTADMACASYSGFAADSPYRTQCYDKVAATSMWEAVPSITRSMADTAAAHVP